MGHTEEHQKRLSIPVTWKEGDTVKVEGKQALVRYVYTNGFTLVQFPDKPITGGIFNNDGTVSNEMVNS